MDSILNSIKKMLGIEPDANEFDQELVIMINSVLGICFQLGVGPKDTPFTITGATETWDQFIQTDEIELVKSYIYTKVRLLFDPPSTSFVLSAYQEMAKEFEWRCNVDSETH